ncbi:hypothetical protein EDB19DRAFT_1918813 [Suillus lakei]|nr:hypothetical protein EDB19DRAFT_1918813 [Suillus lakei]
MGQGGEIVEALTCCQQASSSKASASSAWVKEEKSSRNLHPVNRQAAARNQDHQHGSRRRNRRGTYNLSTSKQQQGIRIISMGRGGEIVEALTSCQQAGGSKASGSSAWVEEEKSSRHLPSVNREAAARHQDNQHGSRRRNCRGTYHLSTGVQHKGIRILTWFGEEKLSRHLPSVNREAAARHQHHQHGSRRRNHRGTYPLSTGKQQQSTSLISMVRGGEIVEALTNFQQASSSKASGSSAWVKEEKSSRNLHPVNRQAAARHQDHQHGSRRRNRRGTYMLSTGKQQQGTRIISMVRGGEIFEALTICQQACSIKASGSSHGSGRRKCQGTYFLSTGKQQQGIRIITRVKQERSLRHLQTVNRQAAATHQDHQHGSRRRNRRGTYILSTGRRQQGIRIISMGRGGEIVEALTLCQQASSSKAPG